MNAPITYMDIEEAAQNEEPRAMGIARTWKAWKQKAMAKPVAQRPAASAAARRRGGRK